mmetsp:Transcript_6988/g.15391  ORF Transcript_6988/g.15391 Transcript_6988/m.15391 type:complete len:101 (-) Transcript_6988:23-325(-)
MFARMTRGNQFATKDQLLPHREEQGIRSGRISMTWKNRCKDQVQGVQGDNPEKNTMMTTRYHKTMHQSGESVHLMTFGEKDIRLLFYNHNHSTDANLKFN